MSDPAFIGDGAEISDCGRYRWILWRECMPGGRPLVFCMLNPSAADAVKPDPTITRCLGFARRENASGIVVVNLSPWRATDPRDLDAARRRGEPVLAESENRSAMQRAALAGGGRVVLAWGAGIRPWMAAPAFAARRLGESWCLGKTRGGQPSHPLMLRAAAPLVPFVPGDQ